ncbi:MAG: hypothetical protein E6R05_02290 [Candidatus Moraniibacteriota bacterium]|nr:MAG: hypothetical protein E6R05_02290 [Candidatus Moranbacteria bacterium]
MTISSIRKLSFLVTLTGCIVAFSTYMLWRDWKSQSPYRAAARESELREKEFDAIWAACDHLEADGARIPRLKMLEGSPMQFIDLSDWNGEDKRLVALAEFSRLPKIRTYNNVLYIRLGPEFPAEAIPTLEGLKNIAVLDPGESKLSESDIARIIAANPGAVVGIFKMPL